MFIEHHNEEWGWGCCVFNNDEDLDPVQLDEWAYAVGKSKPNYPMPAIIDDRDPEYYYMLAFIAVMREESNWLRKDTERMKKELARLHHET